MHAVAYTPESLRPWLRYCQAPGAHERTGTFISAAKLGVAADDIFIEDTLLLRCSCHARVNRQKPTQLRRNGSIVRTIFCPRKLA